LTDTPEGNALFWKSIEPGNPVAKFVEGERPLVKVVPKFSPQDYFSEVTGYAKKKRGKGPVKWTEPNRWLTSSLRPMTFHLEDTERADATEATKAKIGRMFANMVSYTIDGLPGWRDPQGNRWQRKHHCKGQSTRGDDLRRDRAHHPRGHVTRNRAGGRRHH
jgi:hypothetical protein